MSDIVLYSIKGKVTKSRLYTSLYKDKSINFEI